MPVCKKCKEEKKISELTKDISLKIGYRLMCYRCTADKNSRSYFKNKKKRKAAINKRLKKYPEKDWCMNALRAFHRKNKRPTTCSGCKSKNVRVDAHHDDYGYPLKFRYLCRKCHMDFHSKHVYDEDSMTYEKK